MRRQESPPEEILPGGALKPGGSFRFDRAPEDMSLKKKKKKRAQDAMIPMTLVSKILVGRRREAMVRITSITSAIALAVLVRTSSSLPTDSIPRLLESSKMSAAWNISGAYSGVWSALQNETVVERHVLKKEEGTALLIIKMTESTHSEYHRVKVDL